MGSTEITERKGGIFGWNPQRLHIYEFIGAATGFYSIGLSNKHRGKAFSSGIHRHIICTAIGIYAGNYMYKTVKRYTRSQQLLVEEYMKLHPEEFQENTRKYGETLRPWYPTR